MPKNHPGITVVLLHSQSQKKNLTSTLLNANRQCGMYAVGTCLYLSKQKIIIQTKEFFSSKERHFYYWKRRKEFM